MRNLALVVMLLSATFAAQAQEVPKPWSGFVFIHAYQQDGDSRPDLSKVRLKLTRNGKWGGHLDVDGAATDNELQQLYLAYNSNGNALRLGRVFLAACYSTPAPFLNRAARYPRAAFSITAFAYGFQWEHRARTWSLMADFTGHSDRPFDAGHQYSPKEVSFRAERIVRSGLKIAGSGQFATNFARGAVDLEHWFRKLDTVAGLYYSDETKYQRDIVGFVRTEYQLWKWLRPHLQVDVRDDGHGFWAPGVGFGDPTKSFYGVVDYEIGPGAVGLAARLQVRLDF